MARQQLAPAVIPLIFGGGSDCLNVLDHHSGERRKPVLDDVRQAKATIMDALPEIDFVMSAFLPPGC